MEGYDTAEHRTPDTLRPRKYIEYDFTLREVNRLAQKEAYAKEPIDTHERDYRWGRDARPGPEWYRRTNGLLERPPSTAQPSARPAILIHCTRRGDSVRSKRGSSPARSKHTPRQEE